MLVIYSLRHTASNTILFCCFFPFHFRAEQLVLYRRGLHDSPLVVMSALRSTQRYVTHSPPLLGRQQRWFCMAVIKTQCYNNVLGICFWIEVSWSFFQGLFHFFKYKTTGNRSRKKTQNRKLAHVKTGNNGLRGLRIVLVGSQSKRVCKTIEMFFSRKTLISS